METNRDDFIIAIRSAFLKKGNRQRFSLTTLIIISIIILIFEKYNFKAINLLKTSLKEIVYRSTFIVSVPENLVKNAYKLSLEHINLYEDYKKLNLDNIYIFYPSLRFFCAAKLAGIKNVYNNPFFKKKNLQ